MDHLCYLDRRAIKKLKPSDRIFLRVRRKGKNGETWQVFQNDIVYLATKQRPRVIVLKAKVLSVVKANLDNEKEWVGLTQVCFVNRKKWTDRSVGLIEVVLVEQVRFSLASSRGLLRTFWEPIGHIDTMIQGGEMNENT